MFGSPGRQSCAQRLARVAQPALGGLQAHVCDLRHLLHQGRLGRPVLGRGPLLASRGKIDLDAPVTTYLTLPFEANGATIRQLATMTSDFPGVPDLILDKEIPKELSRAWTAEEIVALAKDRRRLAPGTYNGLNYYVLGMIIEKVSGQKYADYVKANLFDKLTYCRARA